MSHNKKKRRRTACQGQEGLKQPRVAGSEAGPLILIKQQKPIASNKKHHHSQPFALFFKRSTGYKFKKRFSDIEYAKQFANTYLKMCCEVCSKQGIVQKLPETGGVHHGYSRFPHCGKYEKKRSDDRQNGHKSICPNCKTRYEISYLDRTKQKIERES